MIDPYRILELRNAATLACSMLGEPPHELVPHPESGAPVDRWLVVAEQMARHLAMVRVLRELGHDA